MSFNTVYLDYLDPIQGDKLEFYKLKLILNVIHKFFKITGKRLKNKETFLQA